MKRRSPTLPWVSENQGRLCQHCQDTRPRRDGRQNCQCHHHERADRQRTIGTAQIALGAITTALIQQGAVGTAQIADGSITDAKIVALSANRITTGTLSVERLIIVGSEQSIVYTINEANGTPQLSQNTIDGGSLTQRSITADRIVAGAITANEIAAATILANNIAQRAL